MKTLLLITLFLFPLLLLSQEDETESETILIPEGPRVRKHQLGVLFSTDYTRKHRSRAYVGFSTGLNYTIRSKRVRLDFGVVFSQMGYRSHKPTHNINHSDTFLIHYGKATFLEIPMKINFFIAQRKKLNVHFMLGHTPANYIRITNQRVYYSVQTNQELYRDAPKETKPFRHILLGLCLGFGFEYKVIPQMSILFQPEVRLQRVFDTDSDWGIFLAAGMNVGLRMNL